VARRLADIVREVIRDLDVPSGDALEPLLSERVSRAAAAWPGVTVSDDRFVGAIAARLGGNASVVKSLEALHTDDLYLACACADGDPTALGAFEARQGPVIERAIAATGAAVSARADLAQVVRQRLLVAPAGGGRARIATYSARGSLSAWIRVVATREAARMLARTNREVATDDDELAQLIAGDENPEIGYLKRLYRDEFKRAFQAAVAALDDRARLVLRQHTLDRLGIDQLAALHHVHRATAARWIESARDAVQTVTERELIQRLQLSRAELDSVIRLIRSQLDVSLPRLLQS
jgi:RNA polymerase sigma-70 factor (ECF subfamily)